MKGVWFDDMLDAAGAIPALEAGLTPLFDRPFSIRKFLRAKRGSQVFAAQLGDRPVIVKRFDDADGARIATAARAEFDRLRPRMAHGPYRVADCLLASADLRCIVMEHAPGVSAQAVLDDLGPGAAGHALLVRCGEWLRIYIGEDRSVGSFGPGYWIQQRRKQVQAADLALDDTALANRLLDWMQARAPSLHGIPVTKGAVHGDFTPMNLHLDDNGDLWGFDIQGTSILPVARDVARFMVTWLRSSDIGSGPLPMPALVGAVLPDPDEHGLLTFFLAEQLVGRWAVRYRDDMRKARMRSAIEALLETSP